MPRIKVTTKIMKYLLTNLQCLTPRAAKLRLAITANSHGNRTAKFKVTKAINVRVVVTQTVRKAKRVILNAGIKDNDIRIMVDI